METKTKLVIALLFAFLVASAGCVNRYEGCPADCCIPPGGKVVPGKQCCPGTVDTIIPPDTNARCYLNLESYWSDWQQVGVLAVLISAFLVALAYMLGHVISNQTLIVWAKNELFQVMASAFILGSLIGIVFLVQHGFAAEISASGTIGCAGRDCHILLANQYLDATYNDAAIMAKGIVRVNSVLLFFRSLWITTELLVSPYYGAFLYPAAGLGLPAESLKNTLDIIIKVMMLIKAQQIALNLIMFSLFPTLLVMGLILRTFFFTRKLGGLLIAVAIGLYLVYPLVLVLAHNIWLNTIHKPDRASSVSYSKNIGSYILKSSLSNNMSWMIFPELGPGETSLDRLLKIRRNLTDLGDSLGNIVSGDYMIGDGGFMEKTGLLLVYSTLIPFIALMTTIGFVRGFSLVLGGDMEIAGLTHLI